MQQGLLSERLVDVLRAGCRGRAPVRAGLSISRFLLDGAGRAVPFDRAERVLRRLRPFYTGEVCVGGWLVGLDRQGCHVRLEAGGQVCCRVDPQTSLAQLRRLHERFLLEVETILSVEGLSFCEQAALSAEEAAQLPFLPEPRVSCLGAFLSAAGGSYLLKGTAQTCITLDYADETDFSRKLAAICRLTPLLALYAENTPRCADGGKHLLRERLRQECAPSLFVFPDRAFEGASFADYAAWVGKTPPVYLEREDGFLYTGSRSAAAYFRGCSATNEDARALLRSVYPLVRANGGIELRMADSLPLSRALSFTALCCELFYKEKNLSWLESTFGSYSRTDTEAVLRRMETDGAQTCMAGKSAAEWMAALKEMLPIG